MWSTVCCQSANRPRAKQRCARRLDTGGSTPLERSKQTAGTPKRLAVDNGPEFISKALDAWAYCNGVQLEFSRPGKPTDNAVAARRSAAPALPGSARRGRRDGSVRRCVARKTAQASRVVANRQSAWPAMPHPSFSTLAKGATGSEKWRAVVEYMCRMASLPICVDSHTRRCAGAVMRVIRERSTHLAV